MRLDIVVTNPRNNNIALLFGYANEAFVKERTLSTGNGSRPQSFAIGDFNNDDHMDIAVVNSRTNNVGIFLGYGNNSFTNQLAYTTGAAPKSVALGDFNNDSNLDIVVANSKDDNIGIFLGYGNGSFANQMTYSTGSYSEPYSVAVGDFNNDTLLDIIVANHGSNSVCVLLEYGNGNGNFSNPKFFSVGHGRLPFSVVVGDFNSDKKLDLVIANEGTDNLKLLLQTC
ncbi:unnamed protein product [Rotaria sordida]|uniref:VCBS repeat-containing protein n=1 Tax=Rotaria sordida TaxID=392033 RepID=A0A815F4P6_9BILA|nr:unnamed protein product [Rotaria sordida]CAF3971026.1 unnamed protein product [Rotaria sordida]